MVKISRKTAKKGFRPFAPENYIMSFIILMQSGFLYRGHWVGIGTGDFYSYNEIILRGNILMVSVDCTFLYSLSHLSIFSH